MAKYQIVKLRLPAEYQEVEYIQSNGGGQWINTLYKPTNKTKITCDFLFGGSPAYILGVIADNNTNTFIITFSGGIIYLRCGGAINALFNDKAVNTRYKAEMSIDSLKLDGIVQSVANVGTATPTNHSILLFGRINDNTVQTSPSACRIYACKIAEENEPMRNYVPCFRKSDGVIGLYDLCGSICPLTGTPFYVNSGTGAFTKGANKTELVKCDIARGVGEFSQLVQNGNFVNTNDWSLLNGNISVNNNICTLHGIGTSTEMYQNVNLLGNHYYLACITLQKSNSSSILVNLRLAGENLYTFANNTSLQKVGIIYQAPSDMSSYFTIRDFTPAKYDIYISKAMLFDLTSLFGSGNEPTTYADARNRILQKYHIDIANYVPYGTQMVIERCNIWHDLPRAYQRVEYIESHGTEWIDTGVNVNNTSKIVIKGITIYQLAGVICGCLDGNSQARQIGFSNTYSPDGQLSFRATMTTHYFTSVNNKEYTFEFSFKNQDFYLNRNGVNLYTESSNFPISDLNLYLFARNNNGTAGAYSQFRVKQVEIFNLNNQLVRNFVPCYRKSDNVIGLYDTIEDKFYTNQGTGTFGKGADVN